MGALIASLVFVGIGGTDGRGNSRKTTVNVKFSSNTSKITKSRDIQGVLSKVEPAVVAIQTGAAAVTGNLSSGGAAGTGFVISSDGYIATNDHVVENAGGNVSVTFASGTSMSAKIIGKDQFADLAVVKIDATNLPVAKLGDSAALKVGDDVVAIGNALALEGGPSVTSGIVSALHRQIQEDNGATLNDVIQTDAAINSGNSGGPLASSQGEVVGINTAVADPTMAQNIGFAISINYAKPILEQLKKGDRTAGFLGVATVQVTPPVATERNLKVDKGALVRQVTSGSPADKAGIKVDDVIVKIDGKSVTSPQDVVGIVRAKSPGNKISIEVNRNGATKTFSATLAPQKSGGQ